ncbi:MAG: hypothetical protein ACW97P_05585 [Candidatus Hodarchaeales archaeon]
MGTVLGPCKKCGRLMMRPHQTGICKECRQKTTQFLIRTVNIKHNIIHP